MPTRGRDIICVYGGTTSRTVKSRTSGGYGYSLKKDDLLIIHDEEVDMGMMMATGEFLAINFTEQLVIDTCRAVASQLEEEGYFIECINDKEAVSTYDRKKYYEWIDKKRGGETIDKDLFKKMTQKIKMLACATYNVAFDKERENKLLIKELRGKLLKTTQRLDRVQEDLDRAFSWPRTIGSECGAAWAYLSKEAPTLAEWVHQRNNDSPAMIRRGKTSSFEQVRQHYVDDKITNEEYLEHEKTEDYIKLLSGAFHSCDGVIGHEPDHKALDRK